jgi:hypothetical protein
VGIHISAKNKYNLISKNAVRKRDDVIVRGQAAAARLVSTYYYILRR